MITKASKNNAAKGACQLNIAAAAVAQQKIELKSIKSTVINVTVNNYGDAQAPALGTDNRPTQSIDPEKVGHPYSGFQMDDKDTGDNLIPRGKALEKLTPGITTGDGGKRSRILQAIVWISAFLVPTWLKFSIATPAILLLV